jgi:hypothetical protein
MLRRLWRTMRAEVRCAALLVSAPCRTANRTTAGVLTLCHVVLLQQLSTLPITAPVGTVSRYAQGLLISPFWRLIAMQGIEDDLPSRRRPARSVLTLRVPEDSKSVSRAG